MTCRRVVRHFLRFVDRMGQRAVGGRVRGTSVASVVAAMLVCPWLILGSAAYVSSAASPRTTIEMLTSVLAFAALLISTFLIVRSFFIGYYVTDACVIVRSWWRTRSIPRGDIVAVLERGNRGFLSGGYASPNFYNSWIRSVGFEFGSGRQRVFDGVMLRHPRSREVVSALTKELAVPLKRVG